MPRTKEVDAVTESPAETENSPVPVVGETVEKPVAKTFEEMFAQASVPFTPDQIKKRQLFGGNGRMLDYITGAQALTRMNEAYGACWNWSIREVKIESEDILVTGTMTVDVPGERYVSVSRDGTGGCKIKKSTKTGGNLDLANDLKAAETVAFKRAAVKFGVGAHLYEDTEDVPSDGGFPQNVPFAQPSMPANLAPVNFSAPRTSVSAGGTQVTGTIARVSGPTVYQGKQKYGGVQLDNGTWYNVSSFKPVDVTSFQAGQQVVITIPSPDKPFINGIALVGAPTPAATPGIADDENEEF